MKNKEFYDNEIKSKFDIYSDNSKQNLLIIDVICIHDVFFGYQAFFEGQRYSCHITRWVDMSMVLRYNIDIYDYDDFNCSMSNHEFYNYFIDVISYRNNKLEEIGI